MWLVRVFNIKIDIYDGFILIIYLGVILFNKYLLLGFVFFNVDIIMIKRDIFFIRFEFII